MTDALQGCIDTCGEYESEYRVVRPDGETRWVHARGRAAAARRHRRAAARRALDTTGERPARRVTRVLEAMPAGFYSLDREWRFTHVNAEAERLLGRSREDLLGRCSGTTGRPPWTARSRTAIAPPSAPQPVAFDAYYPEPLDGWYELRAWPSPDGLSVYFLEVTERRRIQGRAEKSAQRLAILAQVSAELAGTLDAQTATAPAPARRPGPRRLLHRHRGRPRRAPARRRLAGIPTPPSGRCSSATRGCGWTLRPSRPWPAPC